MISRAKARSLLILVTGSMLLLVLLIVLRPGPADDSQGGDGRSTMAAGAAAEKILLDVDALSGDSFGGFLKVVENHNLALYLDPNTTEIAVKDKTTGVVWYSNPPDRQAKERLAKGEGLDQLGAQFTMGYYRQQRSESLDHPTVLMKRINTNNRADSVKNGQFEFFKLREGLRVEYLVGKAWNPEDNVPKLISKERFDQLILGRITKAEERQFLLENYVPVTFVKMNAKNRIKIADLDQKKLFGDYSLIPLSEEYRQKAERLADAGGNAAGEPDFEREQLDNLRRQITWDFVRTITENRGGGIGVNQLKGEDFAGFRDKVFYYLNTPPRFMLLEIAEVIRGARYSPEDAQEDCRRNGIDGPVPDPGVFSIPIEYSLDGANLVVRIPCREIKYPRDVIIESAGEKNEKVTFPLESLGVLPYFGAAGETQKGEIFVPDGSGALIYLNNGKINAGGYVASVYGRDYASEPKRAEQLVKSSIHLPVFGMRQGPRGFLGIIEDGAALAKIRAEVAGRINSYNSVSAEFTTMPVTAVGFGAVSVTEASIANEEEGVSTIFSKRLYKGEIRIRYVFLNGAEAGYVGMAKRYREYLMNQKGLAKLTPSPDIPFFLELIGSIPVQRPVMGINKEVMEPLTTIGQSARIAEDLFAGGVTNLQLEYNGIFRGGVEHEYPARVRLARELGGKRDLSGLAGLLKAHGSQVYPKVNLMYVYRIANGFKKDIDAARYLNKLPAKIYAYNRATYQIEPGTGRFIVSPARLGCLVERFLQEYRTYAMAGLSLGVMGSQLNADHRERETDQVDRQEALGLIGKQFEKITGQGLDLLVNGANDYALPYVKNITGVPMDSSHENIIDEGVPFYQIALHGLVNMAGDPLNLSADYRGSFLKALETGISPYYKWFYQDSAFVKNTRFADLYACHFRDWLPEALRLYREANKVLGPLQDKQIIGHERLMEGVYRTTYENGRAVLVNYGDRDVFVDGVSIEARGYALR